MCNVYIQTASNGSSSHINKIKSKASCTLELLRRNLRQSLHNHKSVWKSQVSLSHQYSNMVLSYIWANKVLLCSYLSLIPAWYNIITWCDHRHQLQPPCRTLLNAAVSCVLVRKHSFFPRTVIHMYRHRLDKDVYSLIYVLGLEYSSPK
jgi:hypothetical protein